MKIGVLQAGPVHPDLKPDFGEYPDFFRRLLAPVDPGLTFESWAVIDNILPDSPAEADAWIITGSKYGVYDDLPWIVPLKDFIRACKAARAPLIGVCFGHQIMAEALGGHAAKFGGGWGLGPMDYHPLPTPGWMTPPPDPFTINAIHQDQVTRRPPDATLIATSDFCENAALIYGDPETPYAISIQPHPEAKDDFMRRIIGLRRDVFPQKESQAALARLGVHLDSDWAAKWFVDFARHAQPKK